MKRQVLSEEQIEQFIARGHVVLHDCFPREVAAEWVAHAWIRLGLDPEDPATWQKPRIQMPSVRFIPWKEMAPKAWAAACDLMGGEERIKAPSNMSDGFIINFCIGADRPWQDPSPQSPGWHKDGDFFRHFLDSPEQGLLTLVYWTDVGPRGGGTLVACDSVPVVARYLQAHPEGTILREFNFGSLITQCRDIIEFRGQTGDVVLLHPFVLHASSQNLSGKPRFLTNPPIVLKEPMNFNREIPDDFSPVEQAVLRGLGVERLDFQPAGPRERVPTERERLQKQMLEEEAARLGPQAARS
ncbi:MAG TPA: hypothetical protein VKU00_07690 [Chthonomonadaceae bacterium]|nr:hypothetical protein [Chthonomonadaceae bacterium]